MDYKTLVSQLSSQNVQLVAVSKTKPESAIMDLYQEGQRIFGENRVQEMVKKAEGLPWDIKWHMIGHLQKNKVKQIAPFVSMIQSVDNLALLETIDRFAKKHERVIDILLQQKIGMEEAKYGMSCEEIIEILELATEGHFANVNICGLMGMASFVDDQDQIKSEFNELKTTFDQVKTNLGDQLPTFNILSMGMSGDYQLAISCGSNMVRIGSLLFGTRA